LGVSDAISSFGQLFFLIILFDFDEVNNHPRNEQGHSYVRMY
jgi:hypothetical protein